MNEVRWSITALRQFETCERQFYYQRILRLPERTSLALSTGSFYHAMIENILRGGKSTLEEIFAKTTWPPDVVVDGAALKKEVELNLQRLQTDVLPFLLPAEKDAFGKPQIEVWGNRYCCKFDFVSPFIPIVQDGRIIDHKPGRCVVDWKSATKSKDLRHHVAQLMLYILDSQAAAGAIVEIPRNTRSSIITSVLEPDDYECRRWQSYFEAQFRAMNSRGQDETEYRLAERTNPLCSPQYCPHWDRCPGGGKF